MTIAGEGNYRSSSLARGIKNGALINVFIVLLGSFGVLWAKKEIPIFFQPLGVPYM